MVTQILGGALEIQPLMVILMKKMMNLNMKIERESKNKYPWETKYRYMSHWKKNIPYKKWAKKNTTRRTPISYQKSWMTKSRNGTT